MESPSLDRAISMPIASGQIAEVSCQPQLARCLIKTPARRHLFAGVEPSIYPLSVSSRGSLKSVPDFTILRLLVSLGPSRACRFQGYFLTLFVGKVLHASLAADLAALTTEGGHVRRERRWINLWRRLRFRLRGALLDHVPRPLVHITGRGPSLLNRLWHDSVSHASGG